MVAQALRQADTDVAIEAWADRSAEPRDIAQIMAEVQSTAYIAVRDIAVLETMCSASAVPFHSGILCIQTYVCHVVAAILHSDLQVPLTAVIISAEKKVLGCPYVSLHGRATAAVCCAGAAHCCH